MKIIIFLTMMFMTSIASATDWKLFYQIDAGYVFVKENPECKENCIRGILQEEAITQGVFGASYGKVSALGAFGVNTRGKSELTIAELRLSLFDDYYVKAGKIGINFGLEPVSLSKSVLPARHPISSAQLMREMRNTIAISDVGIGFGGEIGGVEFEFSYYRPEEERAEEFGEITIDFVEHEGVTAVDQFGNELFFEGGTLDNLRDLVRELGEDPIRGYLEPILIQAGIDLVDIFSSDPEVITEIWKSEIYGLSFFYPQGDYSLNYDAIIVDYDHGTRIYFQTAGLEYYFDSGLVMGTELVHNSNSESNSTITGITGFASKQIGSFIPFVAVSKFTAFERDTEEFNIGTVYNFGNLGYDNLDARLTYHYFPHGDSFINKDRFYSQKSVSLAVSVNF